MANNDHVYEDFEPSTERVPDDAFDTLLIHLPGFKKEQLKVQVTSARNLRVFGECNTGDKWRRFKKNFQIPPNCDANQISAKFENGTLKIKHPKKTENIPSIKPQDTNARNTEIIQNQETHEVESKKGAQKHQNTNEEKEEFVKAAAEGILEGNRNSGSNKLQSFCDLVMKRKMPSKSTTLIVAAGLAVVVVGLYVATTSKSAESDN